MSQWQNGTAPMPEAGVGEAEAEVVVVHGVADVGVEMGVRGVEAVAGDPCAVEVEVVAMAAPTKSHTPLRP